jgi:predicted Zn-dependent protease
LPDSHPTFAAQAFNPAFSTEVIAGHVILDRWRLRFQSEAVVLEIPLNQLQIDRSDDEAGRVIFVNPDQSDWTIYTYNEDVLECGPLIENTYTRTQIQDILGRGELKRRLKITLWFAVGFVMLAIIGSSLVGIMVRSLVAKIPVEWETQVGDTLMAELEMKEALVTNAQLQARLDQAVAPLVASLPQGGVTFKFHILAEPFPNAFALPGGHVMVNTGLLELATRPEEIAGVIAHELAHVTQKHGFRKIISSAGPYLIIKLFLGNRGGLLGVLGDSSQLLVRQTFSQEYELEADAVGWQYLVAARIDPRGLTDMLKKLKLLEDSRKSRGLEIRAFSSHPPTEKRIRRLEAKWKELKDKSQFVELKQD